MDSKIAIWAYLKKGDYYCIHLYLFTILLFSIIASIAIFAFDFYGICSMKLSLKSVFIKGIFIETGINSMYYIRKLYKKSISNEIIFVKEYTELSSLGVISYLISRPIFGIFFYLFASILFIDFIQNISPDFSNITGSLNPWIVILAIYIGNMTGNLIDMFKDKTDKIYKLMN